MENVTKNVAEQIS